MNQSILPLCWSVGIAFGVTLILCRRLRKQQRPLSAACALSGMVAGSFIGTAMLRELYQDSFWSGQWDRSLAIILIYLALHLIVNGVPAMGVVLAYHYAEFREPRKVTDMHKKPQHFSWARVITGGTIYTLFIGSMLFGLPPYGSWLTLKTLEIQLWCHVDAVELNHWATQLLEHNGPKKNYTDYNGTNLPAGLRYVIPLGHHVRFCDLRGAKEECVEVYGNGKHPRPCLLIGSTSFKPPAEFSNLRCWKPGIYIWSDD